MSHTVSTTTIDYIWDVAAGLPVILQDGTNTYVYGLDLISAIDSSGVPTFFTHDGLGSTSDLTDAYADSIDGYSYDVFGALRSQGGSSSNYLLFTGQQVDEGSNLYFLRARYYDPVTGRFLGRDPLGIGNRYSYVSNNPLNYVDPYGLFGFKDIKKAAGKVSGAVEQGAQWAVGSLTNTFGPPLNLSKVLTILDVLPTQYACGFVGGALGGLSFTPFGAAVGAAVGSGACEVVIGLGSALVTGYMIWTSDCGLTRKLIATGTTGGSLVFDAPGVNAPFEWVPEGALAVGTNVACNTSGGNASGPVGGPGGQGGPAGPGGPGGPSGSGGNGKDKE